MVYDDILGVQNKNDLCSSHKELDNRDHIVQKDTKCQWYSCMPDDDDSLKKPNLMPGVEQTSQVHASIGSNKVFKNTDNYKNYISIDKKSEEELEESNIFTKMNILYLAVALFALNYVDKNSYPGSRVNLISTLGTALVMWIGVFFCLAFIVGWFMVGYEFNTNMSQGKNGITSKDAYADKMSGTDTTAADVAKVIGDKSLLQFLEDLADDADLTGDAMGEFRKDPGFTEGTSKSNASVPPDSQMNYYKDYTEGISKAGDGENFRVTIDGQAYVKYGEGEKASGYFVAEDIKTAARVTSDAPLAVDENDTLDKKVTVTSLNGNGFRLTMISESTSPGDDWNPPMERVEAVAGTKEQFDYQLTNRILAKAESEVIRLNTGHDGTGPLPGAELSRAINAYKNAAEGGKVMKAYVYNEFFGASFKVDCSDKELNCFQDGVETEETNYKISSKSTAPLYDFWNFTKGFTSINGLAIYGIGLLAFIIIVSWSFYSEYQRSFYMKAINSAFSVAKERRGGAEALADEIHKLPSKYKIEATQRLNSKVKTVPALSESWPAAKSKAAEKAAAAASGSIVT